MLALLLTLGCGGEEESAQTETVEETRLKAQKAEEEAESEGGRRTGKSPKRASKRFADPVCDHSQE